MAINTFDNKRLLGAFREGISAMLTPVIQAKFPYTIPTRHYILTEVASGTVTQENSMVKVSSGAATNSTGSIISHDVLVYQPGQGALVRFTALFTEATAGSVQEIGIGDPTDGYFIGTNGTEFGITRRQNGTTYFQALPNVGNGSDDPLGQLDITKGNVYQIQYQWLGFGQITYSIYDFTKERYIIMHREDYPNNHVLPSTFNPSFPMCILAQNTTNDTDIILRSSSFAAFVEGRATKLTTIFSEDNAKTITSEINVLDLRVKETFFSKTTRGIMFPKFISVAADGTKPVTIRLYENATLGGTPSYSSVNDESIVEADTAGTTVTGGYKLMTFIVPKVGSVIINLDKLVRIHNLDHIGITAQSANSSDVSVGCTWEELT